MSADEVNGLGAERLGAIFEQHTGWSEYVIDDDDAYGLHCFDCGTLICRLDALTSYERPDEDRDWEELRSRAFATHLAAVIAPEVDRLTRERDEAREVVGRVQVAMSNHPDPCAKHPEDEDGDTACGWKRAYADVRGVLGYPDGPEKAADRSQGPIRPPERPTTADEGPHFDDAAWIRDRLEPARSVEWTFDGPAVRPNNDDEEQGA